VNDVYRVLAAAIDAYVEQGEIIKALTLMQSYAELISAETVSFQERYGFDKSAHRQRQMALSERLPDGPRALD
jgi:hypothetical protein